MKKAGSELMNKVPTKNVSFDSYYAVPTLVEKTISIVIKLKFQNRRSWLDESRLTQSQFSIAFDSAGNESDNSAEDPSITSETSQSKKEALAALSAQRKSIEVNRVSPSNSTYQPLMREDGIRSSRNALTG